MVVSTKFKLPLLGLGVIVLSGLVLLAIKGADLILLELNRRDVVLPQFDVSLIPYHEPRVTIRNELLRRYPRTPRVIFTGDSRVKNGIDPEAVADELHVPWRNFFNFGTGSQVVRFAREAFLPHLQIVNRKPEFLVFGFSPDWPLVKPDLLRLIRMYRESLAYRLQNPSNDESFETRVRDFLGYHFALFRYRRDLVDEEILPDLQCWLFHYRCYRVSSTLENAEPIYFKELKRLDGPQTPAGWSPQVWDGRTTGRFVSKTRFFADTNPVDEENLRGLIHDVRAAGIVPVFVRMPVHTTFRKAHEPMISDNETTLERIFEEEHVTALYPAKEYREATLFVDGHHLSRRGAERFSRELGRLLAPILDEPPIARDETEPASTSGAVVQAAATVKTENR